MTNDSIQTSVMFFVVDSTAIFCFIVDGGDGGGFSGYGMEFRALFG